MSLSGQRVENMGIKEGERELTVCSRKEPSSLGPGRLGLRAKGDTVVIAGVCNRMGASGAVEILYRRDLKAAAEAGEDVEAKRQELITQYEEHLLNPYQATQLGYVDAVIAPSETRENIVRGLRGLRDKRASTPAKKHGNIPL